jgi:hypothetical protein
MVGKLWAARGRRIVHPTISTESGTMGDVKAPAALTLRFKKVADAQSKLTLVRADGTFTSGRIGPAGGYGPVHDLAHFVVEQTLGIPDAFLGLTAAGWDLADFERPGAPARLPPAALWAEFRAGELSREIVLNQPLDADTFNRVVRDGVTRGGLHPPPPDVAAGTLDAMREAIEALWTRWALLPVGDTLVLPFEPGIARLPTVDE